jgi:hypothetical protein
MEDGFVPIHLPSKCLTYEGVDPDQVFIRTFRGKDEQAIVEMSTQNPRKKLLDLMGNILKGVDPSILTEGDVEYIALWEAVNSYTNMYPMKTICNICYQPIELPIDLATLDVKMLPDGFTQPKEISVANGAKVKLRLLTLKDSIEVYEWANKDKEVYLFAYALSMVDDALDVMSRIKVLEEMSSKDLMLIKKFHLDYAHGPDYNVSYTCPKCDGEGRAELPFQLREFIFSTTKL